MGGGCSVRICVATHFHTFGPNLRTKDQRGGEVYIFGKVSSLGVQKFQNQGHKSYKRKAVGAEA